MKSFLQMSKVIEVNNIISDDLNNVGKEILKEESVNMLLTLSFLHIGNLQTRL